MSGTPTGPAAGDEDRNGQPVHRPVLLAETLAALAVESDSTVVDGTVGAAGHATEIARALGSEGTLVGLDRDPQILARAQRLLDSCGARARIALFHLPFSRMQEALLQHGQAVCDRVLLDLGVSSLQLDSPERGFSFMADGPLDMRMDTTASPTAAEWLATVSEPELARVLFEYGDERHSRRIARAVVGRRARAPLQRTGQLVDTVLSALPGPARRQRIHPATRTFQAIRIAVNDELGELERGLQAARSCLRPGGRLVVIAFHSVEDRMVKRFMRGQMELPFKKPQVASEDERRSNPRARSAKLRCGVARADASEEPR